MPRVNRFVAPLPLPAAVFLFALFSLHSACAVSAGGTSPKASTGATLEQYLIDNHYGFVKTRYDRAGQHQIFDARINGKDVTFILDSGANLTVVTNSCARRLSLKIRDSKIHISGVGGMTEGTANWAPISSFTVQNWSINRLSTILVLPRGSPLTLDGLFGFDSLVLNKAILIVRGGGFLIRPGPTARINIDNFMLARGYYPVPLRSWRDRILVNGKLNGHDMVVQVDCGAGVTDFDVAYLQRVKTSVAEMPLFVTGVDGRRSRAYGFIPHEIDLGAIHLQPSLLFATLNPDLENTHIQALIGSDFLSLHHAVIDMAAGRLWLR